MQLSSVKSNYISLNFTFKWVFATFLGFLLSLLMIEVSEKPDMSVLEAAIGSLTISIPQSYLLRQSISPGKWVLSTLFSWIIIAVIGVGVLGWTVTISAFLPTRIFFRHYCWWYWWFINWYITMVFSYSPIISFIMEMDICQYYKLDDSYAYWFNYRLIFAQNY
ncbi:hypothetical protein [Aphanizomenon flos-aquae]|uniref:hypothetical protein n=1 Tax=Aphanizomenon flos-aquae TaxID=1176 RepID=UPI000A4FA1A6